MESDSIYVNGVYDCYIRKLSASNITSDQAYCQNTTLNMVAMSGHGTPDLRFELTMPSNTPHIAELAQVKQELELLKATVRLPTFPVSGPAYMRSFPFPF